MTVHLKPDGSYPDAERLRLRQAAVWQLRAMGEAIAEDASAQKIASVIARVTGKRRSDEGGAYEMMIRLASGRYSRPRQKPPQGEAAPAGLIVSSNRPLRLSLAMRIAAERANAVQPRFRSVASNVRPVPQRGEV